MTTPEELKEKGGIDLTKLPVSCILWVETANGVHELTLQEDGQVLVESTESPFKPERPVLATLKKSVWDDKGEVFIDNWIGHCMRMVFQTDDGVIVTSSVKSAKVTAPDGSWSYDLWET